VSKKDTETAEEDYSIARDDEILEEMIEYFGADNIPNPLHYPIKFEFLVKTFLHHKRMQKNNEVIKS
jgi:hypothetical protein